MNIKHIGAEPFGIDIVSYGIYAFYRRYSPDENDLGRQVVGMLFFKPTEETSLSLVSISLVLQGIIARAANRDEGRCSW